MFDPDLSKLPYRRPAMTRGVDPQRMNWLWRLICELAAVESIEVVEALHLAAVPVDLRRVESWVVSDREPWFFPITLAEMERNVRALLDLRRVRVDAEQAIDRAANAEDANVPPPLKW